MLIELSPYQAISIMSFLKEFDYSDHPNLKSLGESIKSFEKEVYKNFSEKEFYDAIAETHMNILLDKSPDFRK